MTNREIEQFLRFARAFCAERLPWFAPALFSCRIHLTGSVRIAAISEQLDIYFNPDAILELLRDQTKEAALAQTGFLWIHEIAHVLREHYSRARAINADAAIWNLAADMEINDSQWNGLQAPAPFPPVLPGICDLPNGQLAEYYYRELTKKGVGDAFTWDEGSGVHGEKRSWEINDSDATRNRIDEIRLAHIRRQVALLITQHRSQGDAPAGWIRWADVQLVSRVDWRKVLHHRLRTAMVQSIGGRMDYSFRRPSRRQSVYHPLLPPSLNIDWNSRIACVIDTSGSMESRDIGQAIAEVLRILEQFQVPVTIIPCDASAYTPMRIQQKSDYFKVQHIPGGGGTDMVKGIEAALALHPAPDAVVVLTDGYTNYPPAPYRIPIVFGIIQPNNSLPPLPPVPPWPNGSIVFIPVAISPC